MQEYLNWYRGDVVLSHIQEEIQALKRRKTPSFWRIITNDGHPGRRRRCGDSFELARRASRHAIRHRFVRRALHGRERKNPESRKTVLLPAPDAGCPMADMIAPEDVRAEAQIS
jgi:hypothetical protein